MLHLALLSHSPLAQRQRRSASTTSRAAHYGGNFKPTYAYIGNGKTSATSSTPSTCTVASNGTVSFIRVGTCTLTASAAATADYLATTGTPQSFNIGQSTTTISIKNIPSNAKKGGSFTPTYNYIGDGTTSSTSSTPSVSHCVWNCCRPYGYRWHLHTDGARHGKVQLRRHGRKPAVIYG